MQRRRRLAGGAQRLAHLRVVGRVRPALEVARGEPQAFEGGRDRDRVAALARVGRQCERELLVREGVGILGQDSAPEPAWRGGRSMGYENI